MTCLAEEAAKDTYSGSVDWRYKQPITAACEPDREK